MFTQTALLEFTFTGSENGKKSVAFSMSYFVSTFSPLIIATALRVKDYYHCFQAYMKPEFIIDLQPIKGKVSIDSRIFFICLPTHMSETNSRYTNEKKGNSGGGDNTNEAMNMYYIRKIRKIQRLLHGQSKLWTELFCRNRATREAGECLQEVRREVFVLIF